MFNAAHLIEDQSWRGSAIWDHKCPETDPSLTQRDHKGESGGLGQSDIGFSFTCMPSKPNPALESKDCSRAWTKTLGNSNKSTAHESNANSRSKMWKISYYIPINSDHVTNMNTQGDQMTVILTTINAHILKWHYGNNTKVVIMIVITFIDNNNK